MSKGYRGRKTKQGPLVQTRSNFVPTSLSQEGQGHSLIMYERHDSPVWRERAQIFLKTVLNSSQTRKNGSKAKFREYSTVNRFHYPRWDNFGSKFTEKIEVVKLFSTAHIFRLADLLPTSLSQPTYPPFFSPRGCFMIVVSLDLAKYLNHS